MPYIKVYETRIKANFEKACAILEEEAIRYEVLYEYRLYREKLHEYLGDEGAIIRVPKSVFHDADRVLIKTGVKRKEKVKADPSLLVRFLDRFFSPSSVRKKAFVYIISVAIIILLTILMLFWLLKMTT
ncbi:hypothetical protein [Lewinella cohaerens]|uniref:hypothetical protein n=1 Tax=Lewinella cohaerens TaxID=70995 RepID=UPI00037BB4D0|nr:hypothetical protein [Lewinella cohaerens]